MKPFSILEIIKGHGHPETGLPAKKKNSGCAPVILLCISIGGLAIDVHMMGAEMKSKRISIGIDGYVWG